MQTSRTASAVEPDLMSSSVRENEPKRASLARTGGKTKAGEATLQSGSRLQSPAWLG